MVEKLVPLQRVVEAELMIYVIFLRELFDFRSPPSEFSD
jgi:hypothetical protein